MKTRQVIAYHSAAEVGLRAAAIRHRILVSLVAACSAMSVFVATPASASAPAPCHVGSPVVNVIALARNIDDSGVDGHVWAFDDYLHQIKMWRTGAREYCAESADTGIFTSVAGASPEGTGTVSAGVSGLFSGRTQVRVVGTFTPTVSTRGFIGIYDGQCQLDGTCLGTEPRLTTLYFSEVDDFVFGSFFAGYHARGHGTWIQTSQGDTGDITG